MFILHLNSCGMRICKVNSNSDLYELKNIDQVFSKVILNAVFLHENNIFRYGLKYALWRVPIGGEIVINASPFKSYAYQKNSIDFWQTSIDIAVSIGDDVEIVDYNKIKGEIILKKVKESYKNTGVSLAIVFSGNESELDVIIKAMKSLITQNDNYDIPNEIILCGPQLFDLNKIVERGVALNSFVYLSSDIETSPRIIITKKKNDILRKAKYNIVSISHGRISFPKNYLKDLYSRKFDFITPKVVVDIDGQDYPFLDVGLIGSYDLYKKALRRSISGAFIKKDFLKQLKYRVPYVEGSVTVFNTSTCSVQYNENVAWGEAEDVEISGRIYYNGGLIDYFDDIICYSNTMKYNPKLGFIGSVKFKILSFLIDLGLI